VKQTEGRNLKKYSPHTEVCRLLSPGMIRRVALVRANVSDERIGSVITVTEFSELGTTLAVTRSVIWLLVTANVVPSSLFLP
jgi:hypothetical protein